MSINAVRPMTQAAAAARPSNSAAAAGSPSRKSMVKASRINVHLTRSSRSRGRFDRLFDPRRTYVAQVILCLKCLYVVTTGVIRCGAAIGNNGIATNIVDSTYVLLRCRWTQAIRPGCVKSSALSVLLNSFRRQDAAGFAGRHVRGVFTCGFALRRPAASDVQIGLPGKLKLSSCARTNVTIAPAGHLASSKMWSSRPQAASSGKRWK
jgi:hypothetical protein